jgi:hypothetical protein
LEKRPNKPGCPDIEFTAAVKAKELRFDEVPDTEVHPPAQTERENLPEPVRPEHAGIAFRDVSIKVRIADELTPSSPGKWQETEEEETVRSKHRRDSGKPDYSVNPRNEETRKEKK